MGKVTQREIARRAKVSVSTVSRVMNHNDALVSDELRRAVEKAAQELQYTNTAKRVKPLPPKAAQERVKIGVLVSNIEHDSMGELLSGILTVADSYDIEIVLQSYQAEEQREQRALLSMRQSGVNAVIAIPSHPENLARPYEEMILEKFPLILLVNEASRINRSDVCVVTKDSYAGTLSGFKYLLDLGHRSILMLGAPGANDGYRGRIAAYKAACSAAKAAFDEEMVLNCKDTYHDAYQMVAQQCPRPRFTAIFAMTDTIAFGAWQALKDSGLRVPEDVSLVGYDNLKAALYMGMTTVSEPMRALGTSAAYMAIERMKNGRTDAQKTVLQDSLIIRNSCKGVSLP